MSYEKYFKDVSRYDVVDVYRVHRLFGVSDEVLCHASKKILLSGVRTGNKPAKQDVIEARDSLNRWLEMLDEDAGKNDDSAEEACKEYTLKEVIGAAVLCDWAEWVAVTKEGQVLSASVQPELYPDSDQWDFSGTYAIINNVVPPLNFKKCLFKVKK